ncbi:uncharacterized protein LOC136081780 [Hydra vulgaris]|uniref:Uncharacterized protein LOC136081780 n=1 Tax=Hydra vulgaris TaxID=6087 RepID=A0ABM4C349_HYDVU
MAFEPGVLALVQVDEALFYCECAPLVLDATTILDKHVNAFYISTYPPQRSYSLSTTKLAGGTGFATLIVSVLKEHLPIHMPQSSKMPAIEVLDIFTHKIKSCLSHRAPVNSCVRNMLQEDMDIELIQLHCNVHSPETIALEALSAHGTIDNEMKETRYTAPSDKKTITGGKLTDKFCNTWQNIKSKKKLKMTLIG